MNLIYVRKRYTSYFVSEISLITNDKSSIPSLGQRNGLYKLRGNNAK